MFFARKSEIPGRFGPFWGVLGSKKGKKGHFRATKVRKKTDFFCSKWAERPFWTIPRPTPNDSQASWRNQVSPPGTLDFGSKWPLGRDSELFGNRPGSGQKRGWGWHPRCLEYSPDAWDAKKCWVGYPAGTLWWSARQISKISKPL